MPFSRISAEIAALRVVDLAPLAEQQEQVGHVAVGDEGLAAVDDDVVAARPEAVVMPVASEPALGSVMASAPRPPSAMRGSSRCFCSSVPKSISGFMAVEVGGVDDAGRGAGLPR